MMPLVGSEHEAWGGLISDLTRYGYVSAITPTATGRQSWFGEDVSLWWQQSGVPAWQQPLGVIRISDSDVFDLDTAYPELLGASGFVVLTEYPDDIAISLPVLDEVAKLGRHNMRAKMENIVALLACDHFYEHHNDRTYIIKRDSTQPEWAKQLEDRGTKQPTAKELAELIRTLKVLLVAGESWQIDTGLRTLNVSSLSVEILIALLRTTYYRRHTLGTWKAFLNLAKSEIGKRGLNAEEVLFGLS